MHECIDCGLQCGCDGEDHGQPTPIDCNHCDPVADGRWEKCADCSCVSLQLTDDFDCAFCGSDSRATEKPNG